MFGASWRVAWVLVLSLPIVWPCAVANPLPSYCEPLVADQARPYAQVEGQEYCEGFFYDNTSNRLADLYLLGYTLGRFTFNKSADGFMRLSVPSVDQIKAQTVRYTVGMIGSYPLYRLDGRIGSESVRWDLTRYVIPSKIVVANMVLRAWDPRSKNELLPIHAESESYLGQSLGAPILTLKSSTDLAELCWWIQFDGDTKSREGPRIKGIRGYRPQAKIGLPKGRPILVQIPNDRTGWATVSFRTVPLGKTACGTRVSRFRIHVPAKTVR